MKHDEIDEHLARTRQRLERARERSLERLRRITGPLNEREIGLVERLQREDAGLRDCGASMPLEFLVGLAAVSVFTFVDAPQSQSKPSLGWKRRWWFGGRR